MNLAIISLIFFAATVALGILRKVNCGMVAIITSFILVQFFVPDMELADIYKQGWPVSTFFMMLSVLLLFGIAGANGTMEIVAKKLLSLAGGKTRMMPFIIYALTFALSASGAGPGIAPMIMVIAMGICKETGLSCFMMGIIVEIGAASGGLSPIATSGIIARELASLSIAEYTPIFLPYVAAMFIEVCAVYFIFKGHRAKNVSMDSLASGINKMDAKQKFTAGIVVCVICAIIFLGMDVSMAAFAGAAILVLFHVMDEKKVVATVNWNTLILVTGMCMLVAVVDHCGGIDLISGLLMKLITPSTATGIMALLSGTMATVSSATGVVMPTLIPVAGRMATGLAGVSTEMLLCGVISGANCALFCPFSVLGSMTMSLYPEGTDRQMIFKRHLQMTIASIIFFALLGFTGFLSIGVSK